jgi:hypothetical protein
MTQNARRAARTALAALALTAGLCAGGLALAAGAAKLKGQILVSDQPIPTLEDEKTVAEVVKKWSKGSIEKDKGTDTWTFRMMSFPDKKPGTTTLSLVFYDISGGKKQFITSKDISCDAAATILASEVEVSEEDGIKPGMKVELALARIVGDRQTDLARAKLTFR